MSDRHTTFPPFPCKGGGFSSFSSMSIPSSMPTYQPEMAAPIPADGSALIRQSDELLARPVRGVFKNSSSATKTRRPKAKRGDSNAKEKRRNKPTLDAIVEKEIGETELKEELRVEAEEEGANTPTRRVATRSRTQNLSGNSRVPVGSRRRRQRRGGQDSGDDSEDEADRSSDEDFMS